MICGGKGAIAPKIRVIIKTGEKTMSYEIPENLFDGVKVKAHKGKHIEFSFTG